MPTLSTKLRCSSCGFPVERKAALECDCCRSDLARVGTTSELIEWGETRRMGRSRFIWRRYVWGWGLLTGIFTAVSYAWKNPPWFFVPAILLVNLVAGYCLGCWHWRSAEREYLAAFPEERELRDQCDQTGVSREGV